MRYINGKSTTKTSVKKALECQKRIQNYKELQKKTEEAIVDALDQVPETQERKKNGRVSLLHFMTSRSPECGVYGSLCCGG